MPSPRMLLWRMALYLPAKASTSSQYCSRLQLKSESYQVSHSLVISLGSRCRTKPWIPVLSGTYAAYWYVGVPNRLTTFWCACVRLGTQPSRPYQGCPRMTLLAGTSAVYCASEFAMLNRYVFSADTGLKQ